jgi:exopolysaccharide biosynthesis polyprenyl glycosylphosphotransferase
MATSRVETSHDLQEPDADGHFGLSFENSVSLRNRFHRLLTFFEALCDGLTVAVGVFAGYATYHFLDIGKHVEYSYETLWLVAGAMAGLYVILLDRDGAYLPGNSLLRIRETERTLRVSAQTFLLLLPITFFSRILVSRWVVLIALIVVTVLQVLEKQLMFIVVRLLRSRGIGVQNVLIYGAGGNGRRVFSALVRSPKLGLRPVVLVDDDPARSGQSVFEYSYRRDQSVRVISVPITKELLESYQCEFVVVAIPSLDRAKFSQVVKAARDAKARLAFLPGQAAGVEHWTEYADIDGILLNVVGQPTKDWHYEVAKRPFDLFISLALVTLLGPLWLLIAILIRLDAPGPVLFSQQRVGRRGKLFNLYKFRSMHVHAPKFAVSPTDSEDPRITRIGRLLRKTSMDELPQLINVIKGEMSLVGPRPEMPFIVKDYNAQHRQRLQVTPGITGLWQLSADRAYQIHENIQYDLYYIRNRSFFMDFAVLLHTVIFAMHGV